LSAGSGAPRTLPPVALRCSFVRFEPIGSKSRPVSPRRTSRRSSSCEPPRFFSLRGAKFFELGAPARARHAGPEVDHRSIVLPPLGPGPSSALVHGRRNVLQRGPIRPLAARSLKLSARAQTSATQQQHSRSSLGRARVFPATLVPHTAGARWQEGDRTFSRSLGFAPPARRKGPSYRISIASLVRIRPRKDDAGPPSASVESTTTAGPKRLLPKRRLRSGRSPPGNKPSEVPLHPDKLQPNGNTITSAGGAFGVRPTPSEEGGRRSTYLVATL